ncbi:MAG TPA: hypothetical protein VL737_02810 [Candidatus Pristimantibacillus sp.]|nr:hypothetical protein [Candidatus Pristimantibacillus sp.]
MMIQKDPKVGKFLGVPYDWRRPTKDRLRQRMWNPEAPVLTHKWFGWGFGLNFFALFRPRQWRRTRKQKQN